MNVYVSDAYTLAGHTFDTTRKARWVAGSLARAPIPGVRLVAPEPLAEAEVATVHDAAYGGAVRTGEPRTLAASQGFTWDAGLFPMVLASNGGVVAAARDVLRGAPTSGSLSSGLHHARAGGGAGFCTFNGLVIAARRALADGARRVLILDLDAHCGGGTASLIAGEPRIHHADISVSAYDAYAPAAPGTLDLVEDAADYLPTVERRLAALPRFDLCLYNAGMDPFERCPIGGLRGINREVLASRERAVFAWARRTGTPTAFVLAGGYVDAGTPSRFDVDALVDLHRLTILAASSNPTE